MDDCHSINDGHQPEIYFQFLFVLQLQLFALSWRITLTFPGFAHGSATWHEAIKLRSLGFSVVWNGISFLFTEGWRLFPMFILTPAFPHHSKVFVLKVIVEFDVIPFGPCLACHWFQSARFQVIQQVKLTAKETKVTLCAWRWVAYGTLSSIYSSWWSLRQTTQSGWDKLLESKQLGICQICKRLSATILFSDDSSKENCLEQWCFTARSLSLAVRFGRFWLPDESWLNLEYHYVMCLEFCPLQLFRIGLNCSV